MLLQNHGNILRSGFLFLFLGIFCPPTLSSTPIPSPDEKPPQFEYALIRVTNVPEADIEKEFNELARMGYRYSSGGGGTKNVTETAIAMYRDVNHPFPAKYEYRVLVTSRVKTMEKELNLAGKQGFAYCTEFVPTIGGYKGLAVVLERVAGETAGQYDFKVIDNVELPKLERAMNAAAREGFRYGGMQGSAGIDGGVMFVIMYRRLGLSSSRQELTRNGKGSQSTPVQDVIEYCLVSGSRPLTLQARMKKPGAQGFRYEDVSGPYAFARPSEMIVLLSRKGDVVERKYEYLVLDHFSFNLRDEIQPLGQNGYEYLGKLILHSDEIHGIALFCREEHPNPQKVNFKWMTAADLPQMKMRLNEAGAQGYELVSISAVNRGIVENEGICPAGRRREEGDVVVIMRQRLSLIPLER